MLVVCPYCHHRATLKSPKPGRYTPKCPKCGQRFRLEVPDDPQGDFTVSPLGESGKTETADFASKPTPAPSPATGEYTPAPSRDTGQPKLGQADSPATGEYTPAGATRAGADDPTTGRAKDATKKSTAQKPTEEAPLNLPATLDGYQIFKELGHGGMGAVLLARQVSLDRFVALKVMNAECAGNPRFVARFTREAYAAAQLVHHNIVQIYDIGEDHGIHFFSMEYVKGKTLTELLRQEGKLDPEVAVGYALQATRGLKFAHDLGMIHRDIKPDNLMLNDQGIVKVADLGLVKFQSDAGPGESGSTDKDALKKSGDLTHFGTAIGTPAYMSPEQGSGSAEIDGRADLYSLGCTLYLLLTGKQPFEGTTVKEILTKHASTPLIPPDVVVKRVPKVLSDILLKLMAKKPSDRYANAAEVIQELENYLGIKATGPFTPKEEHASALESCVKRYNESPRARIRRAVGLGFAALCPLLLLVTLLLGRFLLAGGILGLAVLTPLSAFLIHGIFRGSPVFLKLRELVFSSRPRDWLLWIAGSAFVILLLFLCNLLWIWIGFCVVGVVLALGFYFGVQRPMEQEREAVLGEAEKLFRSLRLRGLDEETLRHFVAKYAGSQWEEFFEALFGYEAKLAARDSLKGEAGRARARFGTWREPIIDWLETRVQARRAARERKHLRAVEEKSLQAEGVQKAEAQRRAEQVADVLVDEAEEIKREVRRPSLPAERAARMQQLLQAARRPEVAYSVRRERRTVRQLRRSAERLFGPRLRFVVGAVLLVGCLFWVRQNDLVSGRQLSQAAEAIQKSGEVPKRLEELQEEFQGMQKEVQAKETKPLNLAGVPTAVTSLFDSFNPGVAGVILILSAFLGGWKAGVVGWLGAAIAWLGPRLGIPAVPPLSASQVGMAAGLVLAVVGGYLVRRRR
jgi:eukaryotic-like serine/threonine-protein kinase